MSVTLAFLAPMMWSVFSSTGLTGAEGAVGAVGAVGAATDGSAAGPWGAPGPSASPLPETTDQTMKTSASVVQAAMPAKKPNRNIVFGGPLSWPIMDGCSRGWSCCISIKNENSECRNRVLPGLWTVEGLR